MNSGLEARNSLFLIHAVTQTVFTTWTNCLVCFSIFPFLTFVSNIISVFCFELPAAFRLGRRGCKETEWKIPPQFFFFHLHSLPSWHCSSLQQVQGLWASGTVTRTCQGLWLRQEWNRDMWYSLAAAKAISFIQRASSTMWRRKSTELSDDSLGANLGWDCLKQH